MEKARSVGSSSVKEVIQLLMIFAISLRPAPVLLDTSVLKVRDGKD